MAIDRHCTQVCPPQGQTCCFYRWCMWVWLFEGWTPKRGVCPVGFPQKIHPKTNGYQLKKDRTVCYFASHVKPLTDKWMYQSKPVEPIGFYPKKLERTPTGRNPLRTGWWLSYPKKSPCGWTKPWLLIRFPNVKTTNGLLSAMASCRC